MIDTALSGLAWAQAHLPSAAYVDAVWASRYPEFAGDNAPKAKGRWPLSRPRRGSAPMPEKTPDHTATNVTAFKPSRKKVDDDQIAGTIAEIAEQVRRTTKTF